MKRSVTLWAEVEQVQTIQELTGIFEAIASIEIARVKNRVATSKGYFSELWSLYRQLRVDPSQQLTGAQRRNNGRDALVVLTSEGRLSGDIDQRIINQALVQYQPQHQDLVALGSHGDQLLRRRRVKPVAVYQLPEGEQDMDVASLVEFLRPYRQVSVLYETYISLGRQEIAAIDLIQAVAVLSQTDVTTRREVIDQQHYIFEPSLTQVVQFMETVMLGIALQQVILESKLAQYASRFNAMSLAQTKAGELRAEFVRNYRQAKRAEGDDRAREILNALQVGS